MSLMTNANWRFNKSLFIFLTNLCQPYKSIIPTQTNGDKMTNYLDLALQAYRNGTMDTSYKYFVEVAPLSKMYTDLNRLYIEIDDLQDERDENGFYVDNHEKVQSVRQEYHNLQDKLHIYEQEVIPLICKAVL